MTTETRAPEHDELNQELNAYLDGQLDAAREAEVSVHVAECTICARELEELRLTRGAVRELSLLRAPRTFVIAAPEPPVARWQGVLAWGWRLGSVATAACVLIAALSTGRGEAPVMSTGGAGSSALQSKSEAPAPPAVPAAAPAGVAQERSALSAQDSAANRTSAPEAGALTGVQSNVPAATQPAFAEPAGRAPQGADVPAQRSLAAPWILAALLFGVVSAYVYTLDRRARAA